MTLVLSIPDEGIRDGDLVLRVPTLDDVDGILPAFADPEMREAGNLPAFGREELAASLERLSAMAASGRLLPMAAVDFTSGNIVGGGVLHHLDAERAIVEIGYFVLPHARGRGIATRIARMLAEHAFSLGVQRVAA
jgi:ribosomal-protein-alanine N-acetyltransferase